MNPSFHKFVTRLAIATTLLAAPAFVLAQQIVGFEAALTGGTYHIGTDSTNGVVSIIVSSDDIQVTLDPGQFIRLDTTERKEVTLSDTSGLTISSECTSVDYNTRITVPSTGSQRTITITPSSTTCTTGSGGAGGTSTSGGGGGGGGGPVILPSAPAPVSAPTPVVSAPAPAIPVASAVFGFDLVVGSSGDDVTRLQQLLASDPSIYPEGSVTGYFGNLTVKAVRAFQAKCGISQVGRVGPATRAKLSEIFGAGQPPAAVPTPAAPVAAGLMRELNPGASGDDVKALQEFLAKDSSVYPEGLATGYYGPATTNAVRRFQEKYGISTVGRVGPATLKKLQEVMGMVQVPVSVPVPAPVPTSTPTPTPAPTLPSVLTPDPETTGGFKYRKAPGAACVGCNL